MTTRIRTAGRSKKAGIRRLAIRGLVAGVIAIAANLLVYWLVPALVNFSLDIPVMGPGSPVQPLPFTMVIMTTAIAAACATILLAVLRRFTSHPLTNFRLMAGFFLLLSFAAPFSLPVSLVIRLTLASMHIITAAILVSLLVGRAEVD